MSQENMPVTAVEVCSRAMVLCGMDPLQSFSETGRDEVIVASQLYEVMLMAALSSYPWQFATGEQQLELSPHDPLDRYETAWNKPTLNMPLQLQSVRVDDVARQYEVVSGLIYMNTDPADAVIAHYQFRADEADWLPQFMLYFIYDLAMTLASSVTRNAKQITAFEQMSQVQFGRAKTRDSQSKPARRSPPGNLRRARGNWAGNIAR